MKSPWRTLPSLIVAGFFLLSVFSLAAASRHRARHTKLHYSHDRTSGKVVLTWSGRATLECSAGTSGRFERLTSARSPFVVESAAAPMQFRLTGGVVSMNIVGYVNATIPPGLSLITNPLIAYTNTLGQLFPTAPDGTQIYRLEGGTYSVSTFDAVSGAWSNPDLELLPGDGFFVRNSSSSSFVNTFVGEVLLGTVVNPLPAGYSLQADMIPQAGSINSVHAIPGQVGDRLYKFAADPDGNEGWVESVFDPLLNQWQPDQTIGVGEGFMIYKQAPENWIRSLFQ